MEHIYFKDGSAQHVVIKVRLWRMCSIDKYKVSACKHETDFP